jgi:hypothetical protein
MDKENMSEKEILERIIEEEGSCASWATISICRSCPLSKLDRYESGRFISCVEALDVDGLPEEEADQIYKKAASEKLAQLELDKIIDN